MPFDWREYLNLARQLAGLQGSDYSQEAVERSAVSRAYYAAFCWARNYAEKNRGFHHRPLER
jgi:RNA-splicing ligase RtcB